MIRAMNGVAVDCGPCPYLPNRHFRAFHPIPADQGISYRQLMDHRFRRSGGQFYLPICAGCEECRPIRVDAFAFVPRTDQRRCARRNGDLVVSFAARGCDAERAGLFNRYQRGVHDRESSADPAFLEDDAGVAGGELHARDGDGRLLAVSVVDVFDDALSSVYCYYDPDQRQRALGTFMGLAELAWCQANGRRWWYLGFLVSGCRSMEYKARFRPHEVLVAGQWQRSG